VPEPQIGTFSPQVPKTRPEVHDPCPHPPFPRPAPHRICSGSGDFSGCPFETRSQSPLPCFDVPMLRSELPQSMQRDLKPLFDAAARELATTGWKDWHQRTA